MNGKFYFMEFILKVTNFLGERQRGNPSSCHTHKKSQSMAGFGTNVIIKQTVRIVTLLKYDYVCGLAVTVPFMHNYNTCDVIYYYFIHIIYYEI